MLNEEKIVAILEQYKTLQNTYYEFANTIKFILETLLNKNGFKFQVVFARAKQAESLHQKLKENKKLKNIKTLDEIDDLAGCRVIFYLESDIQKFAEHIHNEFSIIKSSLKYSLDDYNAQHIIVQLNEDRLKLTEYSRFKDLRCEIQLTTVLYHAWSQMAHDTFYKREKELYEFDQHAFGILKKQFEETMKDHIKR